MDNIYAGAYALPLSSQRSLGIPLSRDERLRVGPYPDLYLEHVILSPSGQQLYEWSARISAISSYSNLLYLPHLSIASLRRKIAPR